MISKVSIRNFRSLRDVSIDLERFTVFVGPNASGKSSILQGLDVFCRGFQCGDGMECVGGIGGVPVLNVEEETAQALSRGSKEPVELSGEVGGRWYRYRSHSPATRPQFAHVGQVTWDGTGF